PWLPEPIVDEDVQGDVTLPLLLALERLSPARGVYMRKSGRLQWEGVVRSMQVGEGMPLHVGGRFALSLQGHEHYLRLGDAGTITLYGAERPPAWIGKLPLTQCFEYLGKGP
ncbi:AbiEi antitoxin N-terminal domain-containing protein, partial [Burkholderia sp. SIMBA_057]